MSAAMIGASRPKKANTMPAISTRIVPQKLNMITPIATLADGEHFKQAREIAGHQCHIGGFQRDIGALSHCDAHRGFSQRGRIVHAIADHGDFVSAFEQ